MSRKKRSVERKIKVFVEGHSEKNYIQELKHIKKLSIVETPVNLQGGGYTTFINALRKHSFEGYIATFLVLDMDRFLNDPNESKKFLELVTVCNQHNKDKDCCFIIANNQNIETFFEMHFHNYNPSTNNFLRTQISNYNKDDKQIYSKLNSNNNSYTLANQRNSRITVAVENNYTMSNSTLIEIKNSIVFNQNQLTLKHSNMYDFFNILGI